MATVPSLSTGVVLQYPATRSRSYKTQVVEFLDGGEQRFSQFPRPMHRWEIRLDQLTEQELETILTFVQEVQGPADTFSFVDPWDGKQYATCSLEAANMTAEWMNELRTRTTLVIRENRS